MPRSPLQVKLRGGENIEVEKLGLSGYVAAPMGALILGGTASRETVGKFCIGVCYPDGQTGLIAQEEIITITDAKGKPVPYGNAKYPGHPDFDPREGFDPIKDQMEFMKKVADKKTKSSIATKESDIAAILKQETEESEKHWKASKKKAAKKVSKKKATKKATKKASKKKATKKASKKKAAKKVSKKASKKASKKKAAKKVSKKASKKKASKKS